MRDLNKMNESNPFRFTQLTKQYTLLVHDPTPNIKGIPMESNELVIKTVLEK